MQQESFRELGVSSDIVSVLATRSIQEPFPIQALVLRDALAGVDVLGKAPTGSGKTLAFAVPIVERTVESDVRPSALVLVPTRELAAQVTDELEALARRAGDDLVDGVLEAHVQHAVGLVEHEHFDVVELHVAALKEVLETPRCRDDNLGALGTRHLRAEADAAVNRGDPKPAGIGERFQFLDDLKRELASRREHQAGVGTGRLRDALDQREAEGERLAAAGRRLRKYVAACEHVRDDELLDRECGIDPAYCQCVREHRQDTEIGE